MKIQQHTHLRWQDTVPDYLCVKATKQSKNRKALQQQNGRGGTGNGTLTLRFKCCLSGFVVVVCFLFCFLFFVLLVVVGGGGGGGFWGFLFVFLSLKRGFIPKIRIRTASQVPELLCQSTD